MTLPINPSNQVLRNVLSKFGQGAFYAYHVAAVTIATTTTLKMTADTEVVDVCSWFADSVFTPKQPGYYLLFGNIYVTADADWSDDAYVSLFIRKNGATPAYIIKSPVSKGSAEYASGSVSQTVILEANGTTDYFDLAATHTDNSTISVSDIAFGGVFVSYNNP